MKLQPNHRNLQRRRPKRVGTKSVRWTSSVQNGRDGALVVRIALSMLPKLQLQSGTRLWFSAADGTIRFAVYPYGQRSGRRYSTRLSSVHVPLSEVLRQFREDRRGKARRRRGRYGTTSTKDLT